MASNKRQSREHVIPAITLNVRRAVERHISRSLCDRVDTDRASGKTWDRIAFDLNQATGGRFGLTGAAVRRFAVESKIDLAPRPRKAEPTRRATRVPEPQPTAGRTRPARGETVIERAEAAVGTIAHAVAALRGKAAPGRPPRVVDRQRAAHYVNSLDEQAQRALLVELLVAKLAPPVRPIDSKTKSSSSVHAVSGGLPGLGRRN